MIVSSALSYGISELSPRLQSRLEAEVLLGYFLKKRREELFMFPEMDVPQDVFAEYQQALVRVIDGYPIAYITHEKEFYGLDFYVDERVLVPRPETEMLVDEVIRLNKKIVHKLKDDGVGSSVRIADIGTGSGCIALSLAKNILNSRITAVDISSDALDVAKINADRIGVSGHLVFVEGDLLNTIFDQEFDIIVANLPYIGREKFRFVDKNVEKHEPHLALFGGDNGLELYKKMFQQVSEMPYSPQYIIGEFGFMQAELLTELLNTFFIQKYRIVPDLAGIDRMFVVAL